MIALTVVLLTLVVLFGVTVYLLGFQLGGNSLHEELFRVRHEAARAERHMHELTTQAFTAMAEEVERRRRQ